MGLSPDGDDEPADTPGNAASRRIAGILDTDQWKESYRSMPIWQMTIAYFACGYTTAVLSVHFVPFADSLGIGPQTAAFIFALMMGLNVVGSIGAGILSDKFSRKNMLGIVYFVRGTAYMLMLASVVFFDLGTVALLIFAIVAGVSWIATAPLTTALIADVYGVRALGTISGVAFLVHAVGSGISIWLAGELFDRTGSYTLPFLIAGTDAVSGFDICLFHQGKEVLVPLPADRAGGHAGRWRLTRVSPGSAAGFGGGLR